MNIAGSGSLPGGVYDESISISGSGHVNGDVACKDFTVSGSGHVQGSLTANGCYRISGSSHVDGEVYAEEFHVSGSCHVGGKVTVKETASISGSTKCESLRANEIQISGGCSIEGDMTAEVARIKGSIQSDGLLNAEDIEIEFFSKSRFGSIGGCKITVTRHSSERKGFHLFSRGQKNTKDVLTVSESIEGDELYLEHVTAKEVSGRIVTIGPGCNIETLSYAESLELSPESYVQNIIGPDIMEMPEDRTLLMH